jgi:hypothetical protein
MLSRNNNIEYRTLSIELYIYFTLPSYRYQDIFIIISNGKEEPCLLPGIY